MDPREFHVLIVGGGIAGMTTTLALRAHGVPVDLIDLDPQWRVYGAGITVTRPTMRAFRELGLLDDLLEAGYAGNGIRVCSPDGKEIDWVPDPQIEGPPLPGSGGVMRPRLHEKLSSRVRASGAHIRLGLTVDALDEKEGKVTATFSDGSRSTYDLVIGADGLFSRVRSLVLPVDVKPEYTGQMVWRLYAERPPEIDRRHFFLGGKVKVGVCPVSQTHLYMFLLETTPCRPVLPDEMLHHALKPLMEGYGGVIGTLRDNLTAQSQIVMRPLEMFVLPPPWYKGCTLLVGDAAHPTTPQLASGAGIAVEDAIVIAQELEKAAWKADEALPAFMKRRWDRCRVVAENSREIGRREQAGCPPKEQTELVEATLPKLAKPI
ncbi:MAG TPA: FAD-dependent monooxygenase [Steroidobacteraceae bacterium]|nr:FAD-dependent monooxygenase [Steroidobacteraceae bacterium]